MAEGLLTGEVAALAGVTVKAVRHYEKIGLVASPPRGDNGYRRYPADSVLRRPLLAQLAELLDLPRPPGRLRVNSEVARVAIGARLSPAQRRALRLAASEPALQ